MIEKIKKYWKWILGLFIGTAYASTLLIGAPTNISMTVDGRVIPLSYAGDETGESLLIYTEQENYQVSVPATVGGVAPVGKATLYFAVKNNTNKDQNVNIVFSSLDKLSPLSVERLAGTKQVFNATTSVMENTTKSSWQVLTSSVADRTKFSVSKKTVEGVSKESSSILIPSKGIEYFKAVYKVSLNLGLSEEFFIEAFGDQGAYGHI